MKISGIPKFQSQMMEMIKQGSFTYACFNQKLCTANPAKIFNAQPVKVGSSTDSSSLPKTLLKEAVAKCKFQVTKRVAGTRIGTKAEGLEKMLDVATCSNCPCWRLFGIRDVKKGCHRGKIIVTTYSGEPTGISSCHGGRRKHQQKCISKTSSVKITKSGCKACNG